MDLTKKRRILKESLQGRYRNLYHQRGTQWQVRVHSHAPITAGITIINLHKRGGDADEATH